MNILEFLGIVRSRLIEKFYRVIGTLIMRRDCYKEHCPKCGPSPWWFYHFPNEGAFVWEVKYWQPTPTRMCIRCSSEYKLIAQPKRGLRKELYRLPGYDVHVWCWLSRRSKWTSREGLHELGIEKPEWKAYLRHWGWLPLKCEN